MPDPSPLSDDMAGRGATAIVATILTLIGTLFATRKTAEAHLSEALNNRIDQFIKTQTAEFEKCKREHEKCHRALAALAHRLGLDVTELFEEPVAAYTDRDIEAGARIVRDAIRRGNKK